MHTIYTSDNALTKGLQPLSVLFGLGLQSELQALLKRIDARRKEHIKQRNLDSKRLLQRNRNVQTVLESKQNVEGLKLTDEIKKVTKATTALPFISRGIDGEVWVPRSCGVNVSTGIKAACHVSLLI